jgi:hypothetical protein
MAFEEAATRVPSESRATSEMADATLDRVDGPEAGFHDIDRHGRGIEDQFCPVSL